MYYNYYVMNNVMSHAINYLIDYNLFFPRTFLAAEL